MLSIPLPVRSIAVALCLAGSGALMACQIPVFRYALERWAPAEYLVTITPGKGGLSAAEQALVEQLRNAPGAAEHPANIEVTLHPAPSVTSAPTQITLHYPNKLRDDGNQPIWQAPLSGDALNVIIDSPVRQELRKRLLTGQSAIWLLVESGDKVKDDAATKTLTEALEKAQSTLELPDGVITQDEAEKPGSTRAHENAVDTLQSTLPLKIDFSVLRLSRTDPKEAALLAMLLHIEPDLADFTGEPMAFPVFGRGRILEPLIGKGIHEGNVLEHSTYLCGACSCEVKDQNPGIDLLMAANWDPVDTTPEVELVTITPKITPSTPAHPSGMPSWVFGLGILVIIAFGSLLMTGNKIRR
ncbi:MAG: hypothetical protein KDK97_14155 [Verrucomicrobiales bacterium]|nr:hypothetical protein [Verrucomicrobiales bacterium]MCP5559579.1 hypothetical protein [Verrucomicrobiaceae bacterium]